MATSRSGRAWARGRIRASAVEPSVRRARQAGEPGVPLPATLAGRRLAKARIAPAVPLDQPVDRDDRQLEVATPSAEPPVDRIARPVRPKPASGATVLQPNPRRPSPSPPPGLRTPPGANDGAPGGRIRSVARNRWFLIAMGAVLVCALGVIVLAVDNDSHAHVRPAPPTSSAPTPDRNEAAAETWLIANLAPNTAIAADPHAAADLAGRGVRTTSATAASSGATSSYLLSTPELRAAATHDPAIADELAGSLAVATFGSGATRTEVRQASPGGRAALQRIRAVDQTERARAGRELLRNPQLSAPEAVRRSLAAGRLDLRAETLLALLAAKAKVTVAAIETDPATASSVPARAVVIAHVPRKVATQTAAAMGGAYRPSSVAMIGGDRVRIRWTFGATEVRPIG